MALGVGGVGGGGTSIAVEAYVAEAVAIRKEAVALGVGRDALAEVVAALEAAVSGGGGGGGVPTQVEVRADHLLLRVLVSSPSERA